MAVEEGLSAWDVAVYARDIAGNLEAMTAEAGLIGLSALFRACASEAAESLRHLARGAQESRSQKAASEDAA